MGSRVKTSGELELLTYPHCIINSMKTRKQTCTSNQYPVINGSCKRVLSQADNPESTIRKISMYIIRKISYCDWNHCHMNNSSDISYLCISYVQPNSMHTWLIGRKSHCIQHGSHHFVCLCVYVLDYSLLNFLYTLCASRKPFYCNHAYKNTTTTKDRDFINCPLFGMSTFSKIFLSLFQCTYWP